MYGSLPYLVNIRVFIKCQFVELKPTLIPKIIGQAKCPKFLDKQMPDCGQIRTKIAELGIKMKEFVSNFRICPKIFVRNITVRIFMELMYVTESKSHLIQHI